VLFLAEGVPRDEPGVPLAREGTGLLPCQGNTLALALLADGIDAALHFSNPLAEVSLSLVRLRARRPEELGLVPCMVKSAVFLTHIGRKPFASAVRTIGAAHQGHHPQSTPMYALVYFGRF